MTYASIAENLAAPFIAKLGGVHKDTFSPLLPTVYEDFADAQLEGKPDFLINHGGGYTYIEMKDGVLNNHYTQAESTTALRKAYAECFGRCGDHLPQAALSKALYKHSPRGAVLAREHAFNHSLWKQVALQSTHGFQRFLVVFRRNPTGRDAVRYCNAGLVWCTLKTLPDMLRTIQLMRHGFYVPFVFIGRNYCFTVTPDASTRGLSTADVTMLDRGRFLTAVAADKAACAAKQAQDDADWEAGLRPF